MKILVVGGAGYVGSMLVPELVSIGYEVDVVDLLWFKNNLPPHVNLVNMDISDLTEYHLKGYDQVIFLSGLSNDPMAEFSPRLNFIQNAAMPSYLAFLAKRAGVKRFIFASTCSVYGYTKDKLYDENSPVTCGYPYGISKLQGERGCLQLQDENFSVIALRKGTVSGYSPRMRTDLIVNAMFKSAITDGKITVNNPSIWRPICDIRDVVSAYLRAIQVDLSISGSFNIASGNYTVGAVGDVVRDMVEELTDRKIKLEIKDMQDFRNYKVSTEKARTTLGFESRYNIQDIVKSLYFNMDKIGDISNEEYSNIYMFKKLNLR